MKAEHINVVVSEEAKNKLRAHKRTFGYNSLAGALDDMLIRYLTGEEQKLVFQALDSPVQSEDREVRHLAERIVQKLNWKDDWRARRPVRGRDGCVGGG